MTHRTIPASSWLYPCAHAEGRFYFAPAWVTVKTRRKVSRPVAA